MNKKIFFSISAFLLFLVAPVFASAYNLFVSDNFNIWSNDGNNYNTPNSNTYNYNSYGYNSYNSYNSNQNYQYQNYDPALSGAYVYNRDINPYPIYHYYDDDYEQPIIMGPFPRYQMFHLENDIDYVVDDFHHYDEFLGYKDLDVYYPQKGTVEIYRNPNAQELDRSMLYIPEGVKTFGNHVYGWLPGCGFYVKHYDDHPWEPEIDYGYGNNYYTPYLAYQNKPVYPNPCQSISGCQYRYRS